MATTLCALRLRLDDDNAAQHVCAATTGAEPGTPADHGGTYLAGDTAIEIQDDGIGYLLDASDTNRTTLLQIFAAAEEQAGNLWIPVYEAPTESGGIDMSGPTQDLFQVSSYVTALIGIAWSRGHRIMLMGPLSRVDMPNAKTRYRLQRGTGRWVEVIIEERNHEIARGPANTLLDQIERTGRPGLRVLE